MSCSRLCYDTWGYCSAYRIPRSERGSNFWKSLFTNLERGTDTFNQLPTTSVCRLVVLNTWPVKDHPPHKKSTSTVQWQSVCLVFGSECDSHNPIRLKLLPPHGFVAKIFSSAQLAGLVMNPTSCLFALAGCLHDSCHIDIRTGSYHKQVHIFLQLRNSELTVI